MIVDVLAAYRVVRLLGEDRILDRPRDALVARSDLAADLVGCPWCLGFWVSVGVVVVRRACPEVWRPVAEALALSAAVGVIAEKL